MIGLLGIVVLVAIAVLFSERRKDISPRVVLTAFAFQAAFAALVLVVPAGKSMLTGAAGGVQSIVDYANVGIDFLFGPLADESGIGFVLALKVLPAIIFVSSLVAVLYHLRIMQLIVITIGGALRRVIGISRVESLCASANIFVGMVEAPLVIRPYLSTLTRAQLFTIMGVGLSTTAGATLIAYAAILGADSVESLVAAAFMAAPGGLLMSKILVPDAPGDLVSEDERLPIEAMDAENRPVNVLEAAADGAMAGVRVAVAVGAMLLAFTALLSMLNGIVGGLTGLIGLDGVSLETILGWLFAPIAFLIGIPWEEATVVGNLLGQKVILNEVIAFAKLVSLEQPLSPDSRTIAIFALCGFANLAAIAIVLGGLGTMVPARKAEISRLGLKAVLAGALCNLMSAAIASVLLSL